MSAPPVTRTALRICPLCEATCGLEVGLSATDEIVRIRGDRDDVWSAGYLCPKGPALKHLHEDPDRLRAPLVRRDGEFVEVSWNEASAEAGRVLGAVVATHGRRIGTTTAEFGTLTSWLVDVVNAATGNLDRPGGAMFAKAPAGGPTTRGEPRIGRPSASAGTAAGCVACPRRSASSRWSAWPRRSTRRARARSGVS